MSKVVLWIAALAIVAAAPSQAWAQRGRGGFGGGFGGGNVFLLGQKSVQDELKLSEDQAKQATALTEKQRASMAGLRDLGQEERRAKFQEQAKESDKEIATILKPEQLTRFKEIALQQRGPAAYADPEVQKALNLTAEQKEKIGEIQQSMATKRREAFQAGAGGDRAEARKKMEALNASTAEEIQGVLTSEQKEKFKTLTGAAFKGEITRPQFRGGGAGGRGRGNAAAPLRHEHFSLASAAPPTEAAGQPAADEASAERRTADDKAADDDKAPAKPATPGGARHGMRGRGMHGPGPAFGGGSRRGRGPGFAPGGPGRGPQAFAGWHRHRHHRRHHRYAGPAFAQGRGGQFGGAWGHHRHGGPHWGYAARGPGQGRGWHGHAHGRGGHGFHHGYHHGHRQFAAAQGPHGFGPHAMGPHAMGPHAMGPRGFGGRGVHGGPAAGQHDGHAFAGGPRGGHGGHPFAAHGRHGGPPHHMASWRHHPQGHGPGHDRGPRDHRPGDRRGDSERGGD